MVTVHGPLPEHAPDQEAKLQPGAGLGVSVTGMPSAYSWLHSPGQLMNWSELVTVPLPLVEAVNVYSEVVVDIRNTVPSLLVPPCIVVPYRLPSLASITEANGSPPSS